jgi:hypothetical protein
MKTTWQVLDLKSRIADGLVTAVTYTCKAQLDNFLARIVGELSLTGDPSDPGYIPYEDLAEEVVLEWVKDSLGQTQVTAIETDLQNNVTAQKAQKDAETVTSGLPWI